MYASVFMGRPLLCILCCYALVAAGARIAETENATDCDSTLHNVACPGDEISWPTFTHLYAQTVMNAAYARETDQKWTRRQVSKAWEEFKHRCPGGKPHPGVPQPCHSMPPKNVGGLRLGKGKYCLDAKGSEGTVRELDVTQEGEVLGSQCSKFIPLREAGSQKIGRFKDSSSGLCLALKDQETDGDALYGTQKCGDGMDRWIYAVGGFCIVDKNHEATEYCLGVA
mmetsp:Transcript_52635/g.125748  ORF Transcript_52635/g.125748 Transcript_52635/m.125748 type:complete len:226 (+) Transcript_52635:98-775(+)